MSSRTIFYSTLVGMACVIAPACSDTSGSKTTDGGDVLTCDERLTKSTQEIQNVIGENLKCDDKDDCQIISISTDCQGACPVPVAKSGWPTVRSTIDDIDKKYCVNYMEDGCPYSTPRCAEGELKCTDNKCTAEYPY